ncbi:hypothetical protein SAMN05660845_0937 [Flavobacterium swingsii]|jgi:hypothetical protein|uniref:Lipoprotein n=1 Tax=Flavobacterium swingsii TaxID=498292 RepID=A0A1I0WR03_9FLAO|nr:hypothetical protein [Flavobacterium swingsii]SFA91185.1 hypothetical protein SAMN05660845_0937 [Flavobacterium swingsii]
MKKKSKMKNKSKILLLFLILMNNISCGIRNHIHGGESFQKNTSFAIMNDEDKIGTTTKLSTFLKEKGFNVVPIKNATDAIKNRTPLKGSNVNKDIENIFSIADINSVYGIELFYESYGDIFTSSYKYFGYKIINLNTGQEVMTGYNQDQINNTMKQVLKKLSEEIYKKVI